MLWWKTGVRQGRILSLFLELSADKSIQATDNWYLVILSKFI